MPKPMPITKGAAALGILLFLVVYAVICGVLFLLLKFLGFQYEGPWEVVKFFAVYLLLDIPLSILSEAAPKALNRSLKLKSRLGYEALRVCISLPLDAASVLAADALIEGVSIPPLSLVFFVVISYVIDWGIDYFSEENAEEQDGAGTRPFVRFRPARLEDAAQIWMLFQQAQAYFREQGIDQWQDNYPTLQVVQQDLENRESYVLENQDREIVGTAVLSEREEETYRQIYGGSWLTGEGQPYLVIHRVAVRSDLKGQGLASIILAEAVRRCQEKGIGSIRIDTHEDNLSMQRLLEKSGFICCGTIYLASGAKRLAFEKLISAPPPSP